MIMHQQWTGSWTLTNPQTPDNLCTILYMAHSIAVTALYCLYTVALIDRSDHSLYNIPVMMYFMLSWYLSGTCIGSQLGWQDLFQA